MEDDSKEAMGKLLGPPGEQVPEVDFADMKAMWDFIQDTKKRHPKGRVGIGEGIWRKLCSPGADIHAVSYRLTMLGLFEQFLEPAYPGGHWSESALKAASKMELTWLSVGVQQNGFPFDVLEFLGRARAEAA
jgi:hypothetical protein